MRVAHCSDLHLLSLRGARWRDWANKRWIGGLNLILSRGRHHRPEIFDAMADDFARAGIDHVVCTGDLTNVALREEFRFAREKLDRIALGPDRVTVLPGNHDSYVADGVPYFADALAPYHRADPEWQWPDGEPWPVVRVRGPVAIIGLSTSRPSPWFTAYGRLGDEQLDRLRRVLSDDRLADKLRLVALHHPPAGRAAASRIRGLRDHAAFAAVLAETGAELVLHGHEHRDLRHELAGPAGTAIPVHGIQSGSYEAGRPAWRARYRVYEIARQPAAGATRPAVVAAGLRVWSPDAESFVTDRDSPAVSMAWAPAP
jgi:3',5'-cyclic AMP phosphodiesterase CpdA